MKNFLEFTTNKNEILDKKSSIVNISKKAFKYKQTESNIAENEPTKNDTIFQNLNEVLILSKPRESDVKKTDSKPLKLILSLILIIFLLSSGFFGPFFKLVETDSISVKSFWRQLMTTIILFPVVILEKKFDMKQDFTKSKLVTAVMAGLVHGIWMMMFGYSVHFTSITHVYILNNMDLLFWGLFKLLTKMKISKLELCGMLLLSITIFLIFLDRSFVFIDYDNNDPDFFKGECLAIVASVFFLIFISLIEKYELSSPFWLCGLCISFSSSFFQMIICSIAGASWDINQNTGIFGLFTSKRFFPHIIYAFVSGLFYFMFMGIIKKNFDDSIYHFILNLTPIFAAYSTTFLNLEEFPTYWVWSSFFLLILAGFLISSGKKDSEGLEFELNRDEIEDEADRSELSENGIEMKLN